MKSSILDLDKRYRGGKQEIGPSSLPARQKNYWIEVLDNHGVTGGLVGERRSSRPVGCGSAKMKGGGLEERRAL